MKNKILVLGSTGGIGSAVVNKLQSLNTYNVVGWSSKDLDLNFPHLIFEKDLSQFDAVINLHIYARCIGNGIQRLRDNPPHLDP